MLKRYSKQIRKSVDLDQLMKDKIGEVYGLSREPVSVIGKLELILDLGDDQVLEHEFDVLKNTGCTCILGRDLLKRLGPTEFDWQSQQVRLGNVWKDSRATIEGGEPLTRARVAVLEDSKDSMSPIPRNIINQDLPFSQREALSKLLREYESVFAVNPKQPQMAKGVVVTRRRYNNKSCNVIEIQVSSAILTIVGILSYIYYIILLCCGLLIKRERYITPPLKQIEICFVMHPQHIVVVFLSFTIAQRISPLGRRFCQLLIRLLFHLVWVFYFCCVH